MNKKNKVISTILGEIEYCSIGKGIPIVFIHGGHSNCNETLCHKGFNLDEFQLITPSRPGYGNTPLDNNKSPRQAADLIIELLKYLSIENVIIYGISAGGLTAIELAANYPNKISKLILASSISKKWLSKNEKTYKIAKVIFNPKIEKVVWGAVRLFSKSFPNMIAKSFYSQFSKNPIHKLKKKDVKELFFTLEHYNSKKGFLNDIDQDINDDVIRKIKCSTLIIHSENDNSVSLEHPKYASKMIKNSKLEILQNEWGHLFWIGADSKKAIEKTLEFIKN